MKKIKILKTIFWSTVTAAVYFPASLVTTLHLYRRKDPDIEVYVQENLEQIIEEQEKKLGITYPKERPTIKYTLPENYTFGGIVGLYKGVEDTIYLPSGLLVKPEFDWSDFIATIATFNNTVEAKRVLDHELAHFYCDKMKEKAWEKNHHLLQIYLFFPEEIIANRLINEGIARYVENRMNGEEESFSLDNWPSKVENFTRETIYQGGYTIVKPIIDRYGEKGIQFLLFNPPTSKELFTPQQYQERILRDIAKL